MKKNLKDCFILFILLFFFSNKLKAQTSITSSGTFVVNGESFTSVFQTIGHPTLPYQLVLLFNNRSVDVTDAGLSSTTCNGLIGSLEERKYRFAKNRANSMQMFTILKTVFPPQRCAQLTSATFSIDVSIFPSSNNIINGIAYNFDSRISITQEEIAQLDNLIRTTTNFTFPKSTGICNNISLIGLGGINFKFNELHTNPYYNGVGASFDGD